ncbi:argonaute-like protein [Mycena alexandri]|uniref:Argonaute-like protein n=1 Tax=Mycena alexandri TaxID=1745969 RepID=A0AAD6S5C8_9AGAR|nr:argonaute-like protein [Mycena alexandri]
MSQFRGQPGRGGASDRGRGRGGERGQGPRGGGPPRGGPPTSSQGPRGGPPSGPVTRGGGPPFPPRGRGQGDFSGGPPRGAFRGGGGPPRGGGGPPRGGQGGSVIFADGSPANIPPRLSDASHDQLIKSFSSLKPDPDRPLRPGYGTRGRAITLRANFFPIRLPAGPIFDYTVEITPTTNINRLKSRIFTLLEQSDVCRPLLGHIAHDRSARLVSAKKLPQPLNIAVPFYEEGETGPRAGATVYTVAIKLDKELDIESLTKHMNGEVGSRNYNTLPLISALNLALQQHSARTGVRVGKNRYFFPSSSESFRLSPGIVAFQGFYTSVRVTYKQLMVNVNNCMTAFIEPGNLADALLAFSQNSRGAMPTLPKAIAKSIKVTTHHLGFKMRKPIKTIATTSARNTFFDWEESGSKSRISVENYFLKKYKMKLAHPADLPVVDIGSAKKTNYVPAELCEIEAGQAYRGKLSDFETAQMIRFACNPPRFNAEAITNEGFPALGLSPVQSPLDGFNLAVDPQMAVVPGRELTPPRLSYSQGTPNVRNGSWNILDVKFHRGAVVRDGWWVLVVRDGKEILQGNTDPNLKTLVTQFRIKLQRSGMQISDSLPTLLATPPLQNLQDASREGALREIRKVITQKLQELGNRKPSFILVLLSHRDNFIYPGIKRLGDVDLGIHTIHMQLNKALGDAKKQDQYLSNVALKCNSKLGGMNHLLEPNAMKWLTKQKTMMVGIDVSHPSPTSREGAPSIAAVVASVDDNFVQFPASLRIQRPDPNRESKEMLSELRDMIIERLLLYENKNKVLPQRIIVFRDGVSEGQFDIVVREEKAQILEAFVKLSAQRPKPYRPLVSIIICGKRHHARFYPTSSNLADRNGNTQPGTVVDKGVTAVFDFDFYLQAHAGLQGTVRPTHYTVVYDEIRLGADELQQGSNDFSYLYARATKAVSLIPAAYYADLACERGRYYLNEFMVDDRASSSGRGSVDRETEKAHVFNAARTAWGEGIHRDIRESMFYI